MVLGMAVAGTCSWSHISISFASIDASTCQHEALSYLSFPGQMLTIMGFGRLGGVLTYSCTMPHRGDTSFFPAPPVQFFGMFGFLLVNMICFTS